LHQEYLLTMVPVHLCCDRQCGQQGACHYVLHVGAVDVQRGGGAYEVGWRPLPAEDDAVTRTMMWALANLAEPITVATLAARAHMSTRTYLRRFGRAMRTSPSVYRRAFRQDPREELSSQQRVGSLLDGR
jgi:transcriptional regulator GlxA family with amidase domain